MKRALIAAAMLMVCWPAMAAETVYWGMRKGETAKVVSKSGINTSHARVVLDKTAAENAKTRILKGNCKTGVFTDVFGEEFKFEGSNPDKAPGGPNYLFSGNGEIITGEAGTLQMYTTSMSAFRALCPAKMPLPDERPINQN